MTTLLQQPLVVALGWALFHSLWQGAVVGLLAAAGLRFLRRPGARYVLACGALGLLAALVLGTFLGMYLVLVDLGEVSLEAAGPGGAGRLQAVLPWAAAAWTLGASSMGVRILAGWCWIQRLRWRRSEDPGPAWQARIRDLAGRLGLTRTLGMLRTWAVDSPMVVGWIRPVVLVPAAALAGMDLASLEVVLVHELAHVRRFDYLVNLLQSVLEALLFYHPAVWWLSRVIRAEREHCCDDAAVAFCGDPLRYARALAQLEDLRSIPQPGLAVAATGGTLMLRIRRLILPQLPPSSAGRAGLIALLGGSILTAAAAGAIRQKQVEPPAAPPVVLPEPPEPPEPPACPEPPARPAPPAAPEPPAAPKRHRIDAGIQKDLDAKSRELAAKAEAFARKAQEAYKAKGRMDPDLARLQKEINEQAKALAAEARKLAQSELREIHIPRIKVDPRTIEVPGFEVPEIDFKDFKWDDAGAAKGGPRTFVFKSPRRSEVEELKAEVARLKERLDRLDPESAKPTAPRK